MKRTALFLASAFATVIAGAALAVPPTATVVVDFGQGLQTIGPCPTIPVDNVAADYELDSGQITMALDCTSIFRDSFE